MRPLPSGDLGSLRSSLRPSRVRLNSRVKSSRFSEPRIDSSAAFCNLSNSSFVDCTLAALGCRKFDASGTPRNRKAMSVASAANPTITIQCHNLILGRRFAAAPIGLPTSPARGTSIARPPKLQNLTGQVRDARARCSQGTDRRNAACDFCGFLNAPSPPTSVS